MASDERLAPRSDSLLFLQAFILVRLGCSDLRLIRLGSSGLGGGWRCWSSEMFGRSDPGWEQAECSSEVVAEEGAEGVGAEASGWKAYTRSKSLPFQDFMVRVLIFVLPLQVLDDRPLPRLKPHLTVGVSQGRAAVWIQIVEARKQVQGHYGVRRLLFVRHWVSLTVVTNSLA